MTHDDAQQWLDRYVEAWRSNDAATIARLFSEDVSYRFHPWDQPVTGREAVVAAWLEEPDDPDTWEAGYRPFAVDGSRVVATGTSRYLARDGHPERVYHNCFLLEFDSEGACRTFTEFYLERP